MTISKLLMGEHVRLTALGGDTDANTIAEWYRDSEFARNLDTAPTRPDTPESVQEHLEKARKSHKDFYFAVRPLHDESLVGYIALDDVMWANRSCWLAIAIGPPYWNRGYGHEAMQLGLDYAFKEMNLNRVQLTVFDYNERAIALYEKLGFHREGTFREATIRDGQRFDMYLYGLLSEEWLKAG